MKNIVFDGYQGLRLPREVQLRRVKRVIENELSPLQRETIPQIALRRGVNKSSVCRTLQRAERKLQQYLKY